MYGIDLAVSLLEGPETSEHRRKELALVRLMAIAIEIILNTRESALDVRIETARDLVREVHHAYPELRDER